jgi:hypothetical protein|tara:strand:- start:334 stop:549 length:216 start_codon:yes stop_codon:yes gene_type:complete
MILVFFYLVMQCLGKNSGSNKMSIIRHLAVESYYQGCGILHFMPAPVGFFRGRFIEFSNVAEGCFMANYFR